MIGISRRKGAHFALACTIAILFGLQQPAEAKNKTVIGVSLPNLDNPMWVRATSFADSVAKALDIDLVIVGAATHEDKQLADVQSLISRNVDALVVVPVSIASSPGLLRVIDNAHVPVVVADRYPGFPAKNPNVPYLAFIGPNNITAGVDITNFLVAHGVKKVVALGGTPGDSNAEERKKGLEKAIDDAKGVELVQYVAAGETEDNGYAAMQNLLSAHPTGAIDGVWCYNDALCLGAYRAIKQAGRDKEIILGGMDLTQPALDLIERKTNYVYSTGGHWLMIGFAMMIAYDALHGHAPVTDDIRMNLLGVDAKGFDVFEKEYIDSQPPYDIKQYTLTFNPNAKSQTFPMKLQ